MAPGSISNMNLSHPFFSVEYSALYITWILELFGTAKFPSIDRMKANKSPAHSAKITTAVSKWKAEGWVHQTHG
jgi:hypothetical protein